MSSNVLLKILNYRDNKESYSVTERKKLIIAYRIELSKKITSAADVLENVIDRLNND